MKKYARLIDALGASIVVPGTYMSRFEDGVVRAATDMAERENVNLEKKLPLCRMGSIIEHAVCHALNTDDMWSRLSSQLDFKKRTYDIETIFKNTIDNKWFEKSIKIDTKTTNRYCDGDQFAFNDLSSKEYDGRPGANLRNFLSYSPETELLVLAKRAGDLELGGTNLVVPTHVIHRDAFTNCRIHKTNYLNSPLWYIWYDEMIKAGYCVKINPSETTLTLK